MGKEDVWKVGPVMRSIYRALQQSLGLVEKSCDVYLDSSSLSKLDVRMQDWDLTHTDDYFACMREEDFATLKPSDPDEPIILYEDVEYPGSAPPRNVFDREDSAFAIEHWFQELQKRKVSVDGDGCEWPEGLSRWVPREKYSFENLRNGSRMPPSVPRELSSAYYNDDQPHQIYHACHADEAREGIVLRSELQILIRCMMGRVADPALCIHNVPILLLSIHGVKARIMIFHFNIRTMKLEVKCSGFEQFDGFEAQEGKGSTNDRMRPHDFEAKRDLFFRWINPICKGNTYLKDSEDAPEMVMRGPRGRKRLRMAPKHEKTKTLPKDVTQWRRLAKQWGSQGAIKNLGSTEKVKSASKFEYKHFLGLRAIYDTRSAQRKLPNKTVNQFILSTDPDIKTLTGWNAYLEEIGKFAEQRETFESVSSICVPGTLSSFVNVWQLQTHVLLGDGEAADVSKVSNVSPPASRTRSKIALFNYRQSPTPASKVKKLPVSNSDGKSSYP